MARYALTEEHRAQLGPWRDRWIANAMSTRPMDDAERARIREAVRGLYRAAGLTPPPDDRIVFVPSPFVLRFAGGFAAWIWHTRRRATYAATADATDDATAAATYDATAAATRAATDDATDDDLSRWYRCEAQQIARLATRWGGPRALESARLAYRLWNGGNQWSGWAAYLSFFRHVARLSLDYAKWDHYEVAASAGPRVMHREFCLISERPTRLLVDAQNRPHCEDGPFCSWRDGSALYSWHGVRVPGLIIEHPERITAASIDAETNAEIRRVMLHRYGTAKYISETGAEIIHRDEMGELYRREMPGDDPILLVKVINATPESDGSRKPYWLRVHPECRPLPTPGNGMRLGEPQPLTARNAIASTFGQTGATYRPAVET